MHAATVLNVDGRLVVTHADDVLWMTDELWKKIVDGTPTAVVVASTGGARVDDDVLRFGTAGAGLGRLAYRYLGRDLGHGMHVLERIG